jgi:hypothetical protein
MTGYRGDAQFVLPFHRTMDYEKYKKNGQFCIFQNSILLHQQHLYENVKFLFPYDTPNTFHAEVAIYGDNNKIIVNSNSYIEDTYAYKEPNYEDRHRIYARINYTYDILCNTATEEHIDERVCSFMTPFDSVNFGHNLSIIFDFIHQYRSIGLNVPIVLSNVSKEFPNILRILELFFDDIRFIDNNKVYSFKEIYFFTPIILDICRHQHVISETVYRSLKNIPNHDVYKNKNVFMVKLLNRQTNIVETSTAFYADTLLETLKTNQTWIVIQPEVMSIYEIIAYLHYANSIVTSEGAISYGHAIFFNKKAVLHFLVQNNNKQPYLYINWMKYLTVGKNLDNHVETILNLPNVEFNSVTAKPKRLLHWLNV